MAKLALVNSFWKTVKHVSVKEIAREAQRPFALAVVGAPSKRAELYSQLFPKSTELDVLPERSLIRAFDDTSETNGFPRETGAFDFIVDAGGGRVDSPAGARVFSVDELGGWDEVAERILDERPDLNLSLARRFPGLRPRVAQRVIRETAIANAEFAMLSALPGVIPIIGPLLPPGALADIIMLTKNQAMMLYRLAAIYELPLDASSRSRDLAPLLANAFGWRALAREIVGAIPGGVGLIARGTIAYAGTAAVGKGLLRLYQTGQKATRAQINQFYRESLAGAKEAAQGIAKRLTHRRRKAIAK